MLVAGAALSLIAPIGAQANDINFEGMNSYSRSKSTSKKLKQKKFNSKTFSNELAKVNEKSDVLESNLNQFEAGSFSSTTTMNGKVVYAIGAVDGGDTLAGTSPGEALSTAYVFKMELNTSFTGDDNLYTRLSAGRWDSNFTSKPGNYHIEAKNTTDEGLIVDKLWYQFPVGDQTTVWIGPRIENYYMMAASPSIYKPGILKGFKLGGNGAVFGASTDGGAGIKYEFGDSGFAASTNFVSRNADSNTGLFTVGDKNKIDTQFAYTKPQYHASVTYSKQRGGWDSSEYFTTADIHNMGSTASADAYAFRAYWRPEESGSATPEITVGYDMISFDNHNLNVTEGSGYFVGLTWQDMIQADDRIGVAIGQPVKATEVSAATTLAALDEVDPFMWEAYYSFKPNDSITVTPAIWGGTDVSRNDNEDVFGTMLTTTFKF